MPQATVATDPRIGEPTAVPGTPYLNRLVDFTEPSGADVCLDVSRPASPLPAVLSPRVRDLTRGGLTPAGSAEETSRTPTVMFAAPGGPAGRPAVSLGYDDGAFSLVTAHFAVCRLPDPAAALRELLRVCRPDGRVIVADLVRPDLTGAGRDHIERLRDPGRAPIPTLSDIGAMIAAVGGRLTRLDLFTVQRPVEPWLAEGSDKTTADRVRTAFLDELDGGPATGSVPRLINGELWFTQSWAYLAIEPRLQ